MNRNSFTACRYITYGRETTFSVLFNPKIRLRDKVRNVCGLKGNFRLQYQDRDFGDTLVNSTSTAELDNLAPVKVITLTEDFSQGLNLTGNDVSTQGDDTELLSTPSRSVSPDSF